MSRQTSLSTYDSNESQLRASEGADMYDMETEVTHPAPPSPRNSDTGHQSMVRGSQPQGDFDGYEEYPREAYTDHLAEPTDVYGMGYKTPPQVSAGTYDSQKYLQDMVLESESYGQYHDYLDQVQFDDMTWPSPRPW